MRLNGDKAPNGYGCGSLLDAARGKYCEPFPLPTSGGVGLWKPETCGRLGELGYGDDGFVAVCHHRGDIRAISDFKAGIAAAQIAQFVSMLDNVYSILYVRSR